MKIGIHVKIGKGLGDAVRTAANYNCNTFQLFSRSPRGGKARVFGKEELTEFHKLIKENGISPVVVHMPYVLNLANPDEEMHKYAVQLIGEDLERCSQLGAQYLVLHMGSHRGAGEETGMKQMLKGLEQALGEYIGETVILLENTSGSGNELGYKFEHLAWLIKELDLPGIGVCFDTCHAFGAGYNLVSATAVDEIVRLFNDTIGLQHLRVVHCNDSAFALGTKKDRHAHIGKGYIGLDGFRALLNHKALREVPFILETPVDEEGGWEENLQTLRSLVEK